MSRVYAAIGLFGLGILLAGIATVPLVRDAFAPVTPVSTNREVQVDAEGRRMLWVRESDPATTCEVTDADGDPVPLGPVGRVRHDSEHGYLRATAVYEATGGEVTLDCRGEAMTYESMAYDGAWMLDRLVPVFVPFLLLTLASGVVILVEVLTQRRRTREAAPQG